MENREEHNFHSAEVQEILGKIPPAVTRYGTAVIFVILLAVIGGSSLIRLPQTVTSDIKIFPASDECTNLIKGFILIRPSDYSKVSAGQTVYVKVNEFPWREYGMLYGTVTIKEETAKESGDGERCYMVYVSFPDGLRTTTRMELPGLGGLEGMAEITVGNITLLNLLMSQVKSFASDHNPK